MRRSIATRFFIVSMAGTLVSFAAGDADEGIHRMQFPGKTWAISVSIPGFKIEEQWTRGDGSGMMIRGHNEKTGVILSLYLERESKFLTSAECRDRYFRAALSSPPRKSMVKQWAAGPFALGQYMLASIEGMPFRQMHVNAYLGKEDICMDLHLSKGGFEEADRPLFDAIIASVKVVEGD